jgi:hypothetical protein
MYTALPHPLWFSTGATLWIMSQCRQTESLAYTSRTPARARMSRVNQRSSAGKCLIGHHPVHLVVRDVPQPRDAPVARVRAAAAQLAATRSHPLERPRHEIIKALRPSTDEPSPDSDAA